MPELQRLRPDHAPELLAFERENRSWFARTVPDRTDAFFAEFHERLSALLAEQDTGACHFHVLVADDGSVLGRFNLVDASGGAAELGYRIARCAAGRGLATDMVGRVCTLAHAHYGLHELRAETTLDNPASLTVLGRNGFSPAGEITLDGRPGRRFVRRLGVC